MSQFNPCPLKVGKPNLPRGSRPNQHRITLFREASTDFRREREITEKLSFVIIKNKYIVPFSSNLFMYVYIIYEFLQFSHKIISFLKYTFYLFNAVTPRGVTKEKKKPPAVPRIEFKRLNKM